MSRLPCGLCLHGSSDGYIRPKVRFRWGDKELPALTAVCRKHEPLIEYQYEHGCGAVLWTWPGVWYYQGENRSLVEYKHEGWRIVVCPSCGGELPGAVPVGPTERRLPS